MKHNGMKSGWITVLLLAGVASFTMAQDVPMAAAGAGKSMRSGYGFASVLEQQVGLSPEQRDSVRGLLADQRQKTQTIREETDAKIRAILNADQQKKFDTFLAAQKSSRASHKQKASGTH